MDWVGIIETAGRQGFLLGLVALSVAISFRVLRFPDLTVEGSFPLGGAVAATLIIMKLNPITATVLATVAGAVAGAATGFLNAKMRISGILAGILVMTMLYSVNLRIMGRPNISLLGIRTILTPLEKLAWPYHLGTITFYFTLVFVIKLLLDALFRTNFGLLLQVTGNNARATLAAGRDPGNLRIAGLAIANALAALSGAVLAQSFGFADIGMGAGIIVIGFASLLIGEALLSPRTIFRLTLAALLGAFVYETIVAAALRVGLMPTDLKLITALMVMAVLSFQSFQRREQASEFT